MQRVADSLTGGFGVAAASIAIAFVGYRWLSGSERALESLVNVVVGCAFIFGGAVMISSFAGGAGATPVTPLALSTLGMAKDILGELLGHAWAVAWVYGAWRACR